MTDSLSIPKLGQRLSSSVGYEACATEIVVKSATIHVGSSVYFRAVMSQQNEQRFNKLKDEWLALTMFISNMDEIVDNKPYNEIINMGWQVVPFIIKDLAKHQNLWFHALIKITGENPSNPENAGEINKLTKDWLQWANQNNIVS